VIEARIARVIAPSRFDLLAETEQPLTDFEMVGSDASISADGAGSVVTRRDVKIP